MGRWTPTVLPEAPDLAPMFDIGGALEQIAGGIRDYKSNKRREAAEQKADDRYYAEKNERAIERYKADQRQAGQDKIAAEDRQRRNERDYLDTKGRAADDGYVTGADRAERQGMARTLKAGGGLAGVGIGDALLAASSGEEALTLTRPDNAQETLYRDPTRTKEARDENQWRARQTYLDRQKPAPVDTVANELREYEEKIKLDKKYGINDFAPDRRGGGRGSGGGGGGANDPRLAVADKMFDNADRVVARIEREEPQAPDYSKWRGGDRPLDATDPDYPAFKTDSTALAQGYDQKHRQWTAKLGDATRKAQQWFTIGDALAKEAVGATGGDAVFTSQQINAHREIAEATKRLNNTLLATRGDPEAEKEIRQRYYDEVNGINAKYGIRPKPED